MAFDDKDDETTVYLVLMNSEEQYSLWPRSNSVPNGWKVMKEGTRAECGKYVTEVWTDMRPLSLRKHMEEFARKNAEAGATASPNPGLNADPSAGASPNPAS